MKKITYSRLLEVLSYNQYTGVFTWRFSQSGVRKDRNGVAGCVHTGPSGYQHIFIRIDNKLYKAYRLAWLYMEKKWPENEIDHIDHNATNNIWANLRDVTKTQNAINKRIPKNNTSGVVGVTWHKTYSKWVATINNKRESIFLGCFKEFSDAVSARLLAEEKFGYHKNHGT